MKKRLRESLLRSLLLPMLACTSDLLNTAPRYDGRQVSVQFVSFYNQRFQLRDEHRSWQGDWVLRRERLALFDRELRAAKPDLLILQELMAKKGSAYDADTNILTAGALAGYEWQLVDLDEYQDTHEVESMAVAVGLPLRTLSEGSDDFLMWRMGGEGRLAIFSLVLEEQPITIVNVKLPANEARQELWYKFMRERIDGYLESNDRCVKRLVVAGSIAAETDQPAYKAFLETFGLVDVSLGFCEKEEQCYTATPANDLFRAVEGDKRQGRPDRILIHQSALVYSSRRNFQERERDNEYARFLGLEALWPGPHFGWSASVRFARCYESSLFNF